MDVSGFIGPVLIMGVGGGALAIYAVVTLVLLYHWKKYTLNPGEFRRVRNVYLWVSVFLWIVAIVSGIQSLAAAYPSSI